MEAADIRWMQTKMQRRKNAIRLLFATVILSQLAEYMIRSKYGEPYPALNMPSFAGTLTDLDGNVRFTNVKCKVLFRDGHVAWASVADLMPEAPSPHRDPIVSHMFGLPSPNPQSVVLGTLKARVFPGKVAARARDRQKELDPHTKAWLRQRLQSLYPSEAPVAIAFIWYENVFNVNLSTATEELLGTREVRLE